VVASLDYYATIRSLYRQRRAALVHGQRENLPPPASFSRNDHPAIAMRHPRQAAMASEARIVSGISW